MEDFLRRDMTGLLLLLVPLKSVFWMLLLLPVLEKGVSVRFGLDLMVVGAGRWVEVESPV